MPLKLFVDFDGTITRNDVGNDFFHTFGGPRCEVFVREYREGGLSAVECFCREAAAVGHINRREVIDFFRSQPLDGSFSKLVRFCRECGIELTVLSDGLDYYIREIFETHGIRDVRVVANEARFVPDSGLPTARLELRFPYTDAECIRCACCKRNLILTESGDDDMLAYVGEGYSDTCPVQYVDIVFAKDDLQRFCRKENISYYPYSDFLDVISRLKGLMKDGKHLRRRRRAELKRREAFLRE